MPKIPPEHRIRESEEMKMMIKWAVGGAVIGIAMGLYNGDNIGSMAVVGGVLAVALRKWIFRNFWM